MTKKAAWHTASMLAAGLFMGLAAPSHAANGTDDAPATAAVKPVKHLRHVVHHRHKPVAKAEESKAAETNAGNSGREADAANGTDMGSNTFPPAIANANAQASAADDAVNGASSTPAGTAPGTSGITPAVVSDPAGSQVVSADQLNDIDRTLREPAPPPPVAMASNEAAAQPTAVASSAEHSVWGETSLIGKIFIGFGTLLTIASAARMLIA